MANGIRGITIEIGGDTRGLDNALRDVNKQSKDLQSELKQVERALKFDPGNTELIRQQQELLAQSIQASAQKLETLRAAQSQVEAQFRRGEIGVEQYRAFQRELQSTEGEMNRLQGQLNSLGADQDRLAQTTRQLGTFFEATGTDVEQFAGTLGTRLTQAIRDGSASADQMERALRLMGRQALGASVDIDRMREALRTADDGANLNRIRQDLSNITQEANQAGDAVNGFGQELSGVVAGLAAGGGIAGVVQQALDVSSLNTKIDISFEVPEESKASVRDAIKTIEAYGVDGEEALEGVRRQWALNKDASNEANAAIVQGAGVVAKAYQGIDFIELIQEVNEIGAALFISNEEALALTNALLKAGFPPEQLDTIAEYGQQMADAGFSAQEIQAIFEAGIDTKTWNIDNLNDGVKEARINMASFGDEVPKALAELLTGTDVSSKKMQEWGKAVADGGKEGSKAMSEMVTWLDSIEDSSLKNALATEIFKTKWEDQGENMLAVFNGIDGAIDKTTENQQKLQEAIDKTNADPLVKIKDAFAQIQTALAPVLTIIANLVAKIAQWVSDNVALTAAIVAIVAVLGILAGAFAVLMPVIGGLVTAWPALAVAIGAISAPITLVIGAIAGLGVALVAAYQSSETFRENVNNVFQSIKDVAVTAFETVASFIGEKIAQIKQFWDQNGQQILQAVQNVFNGIKAVVEAVMPAVKFIIETVWNAIKNIIDGALNVIMGAVKVFSGLFTGDFSKMWEGIKNIFSGAIELIMGLMTLSFFGGLKTLLTNLAKTGVSLLKGMWDDIGKVFSSMTTSVVNFVKDMASKVVSYFSSLLSSAKSIFGTLRTFGETTWNALKTVVINAAKKIWEDVVTNFTGLLTSVKTTMTTVKTTISDLWGKAVAAIKPNSLFQVGKDVVSGLIKGIGEMFGGVQKKIEALAASIPEWAKKVLGIHSPSRVMMQIGLWTGEGLVIGLDNSSVKVNQAMKNIGNGILAMSKNYQAEYTKLLDEHNRQNEDKNEKTLEKIYKIRNAAAKKKRALTQKELQDIALLEASYRDSKLKSEQDFDKKYKAMKEKSEKEYLEVISNYIANKKSLEEMSLIDEAAIWEQSIELFVEGSNERIKAQQNHKKAVEAVNKEIVAINQDYQSQMQKINDDLLKEEERLNKEYKTVYDNRVSTLMSFAGTFDEFKVELNRTGQELLNNLQGQVDGFKQWQDEFAKLSERGIDKNLLNELSELGVKALPELVALNSMTNEQLSQYSALYQEKSALARQQAESELVGMKEDTDKRILELREVASKQLDNLKTEWSLKIKGLTSATATELSSLQQIGVDAGQGLLNGLASMEGPLISKAQQIANAISSTIQQALDIHSPSRVMKGFGINIGEGLIVGMDEMISKVARSSARLSDAVQNVHTSLASSAAKSANTTPTNHNQKGISTVGDTTTNQVTMNFYSPKAIDPYEASRQSRNALRELALQL